MITGSEAIGDVPGLKSVASTQIAPASASARAGGVASAFISSAPGSSTAAVSEAASGPTSSGWMTERWSTERAPRRSATGTERMVESCSTCARSGRPRSVAIAPMRSSCSSPNATDSTKMSSASTSHSRASASASTIQPSAVNPGGTACANSPVSRIGWTTRAASSRPSRAARASPSRESP